MAPVSLLGITMATAVFPSLSEAALTSTDALRLLLRRTAGTVLMASLLAALLMYLIRQPLVALLLGGGAFATEAVSGTARLLGVFCLSIPTESLSHLLARAFYSQQNTIIPVTFSAISLLVTGVSAYLLMGRFGLLGLPLGFFLGSCIKTVGLYTVLVSRQSG